MCRGHLMTPCLLGKLSEARTLATSESPELCTVPHSKTSPLSPLSPSEEESLLPLPGHWRKAATLRTWRTTCQPVCNGLNNSTAQEVTASQTRLQMRRGGPSDPCVGAHHMAVTMGFQEPSFPCPPFPYSMVPISSDQKVFLPPRGQRTSLLCLQTSL